ncbi:MAG TPA: glycosyltransferase family 4 protein [Myxococcaceae bacterium]|nr:glycosyltransferase family 4 protein [Myxococcaceae bacterium]
MSAWADAMIAGAGMTELPERLRILCVSQVPPSPPRFGAQARIHGLMTQLARRHDLSAICLVDEELDLEDCRDAMQSYCREVVLLRNPNGRNGLAKRSLQLRSLASLRSFERHRYSVKGFQEELDRLLRQRRFDVVNLEFPYLAHCRMKQSPPGTPPPLLVIDAHEIAHDMVRQFARNGGVGRKLYAGLDWRKLRREELSAFRGADGIFACSVDDQRRILRDVHSARTTVVPNAADVEFYRPRPSDPPADGRTVVFFGLLSTYPNIDGALWFLQEIWPRVVAARPDALCKIIGKGAPRALLDFAGPRVEIAGLIADLRPHLASAAALVVPLRIGGGTRLKIVEGMSMAKAIVSTTLGAEGIDVVPERDILIADDPESFAASVVRLLDDPALGARLGSSARRVAVERYAWSAAAARLEQFYRELLADRRAEVGQSQAMQKGRARTGTG